MGTIRESRLYQTYAGEIAEGKQTNPSAIFLGNNQ
jgi:hypothetical protein